MNSDKSKSMFECDCGQSFDDKIQFEEHKLKTCENRYFPCAFCNESIQLTKMSDHLYYCGNKTTKCPSCSKYIRRAIYNYHSDNNCFDLIEDIPADQYELMSNRNKENKSNSNVDEQLNSMSIDNRNLLLNSDSQFENQSLNNEKISFGENPAKQIQKKTSDVRCELTKDYYSTEIDHALEKVLFNIILMGSPRVGKSQLINALCKRENLAETSPSLNSCTKTIQCYVLEDDQEQTPGIEPFRIYFYDTPGIESWTNENGQSTMLKFIEEKNPVCLIYCASPGSFADLKQLRPVLQLCKEKNIFCALVCTNMWSNSNRKLVVQEFEKELHFFGQREEKFFDQGYQRQPHKVTIFGNGALSTMVNSIEYHDEELDDIIKPVQGIDELIHCIMEQLDQDKLVGWCNAVLYRRSFWQKVTQKVNGFCSTYLPNLSNTTNGNREQILNNFLFQLSKFFLTRK